MSTIVTPEAAAVELEAPLTEWALKIPVSISDSLKQVFNHLAIELLVTGRYFPIQDKKEVLLAGSHVPKLQGSGLICL